MYEERLVDVASYVCHVLDQIPAFSVSPMYVDWLIKEATEQCLTPWLWVFKINPRIHMFQRTESKLPSASWKSVVKQKKNPE